MRDDGTHARLLDKHYGHVRAELDLDGRHVLDLSDEDEGVPER